MNPASEKLPLSHYAMGYDPAKAHDYYMRTRRLHPRQKGAQRPPGARQVTPQLLKDRAAVAEEVSSLQKKLGQLNAALKVAMAKEKPKLSASQRKSRKKASSKKYQQTHKSQIKNKARSRALSKMNRAKATKAALQKVASGGSGGGAKGSSTGPGSVKAIQSAIAGVQKALANARARQKALG